MTNKDSDNPDWKLFYRNHLYINEEVTEGNLMAEMMLKSVSTMGPFPLYTSSDEKVGVFHKDLMIQVGFVLNNNKFGVNSTTVYEHYSSLNWSLFGLSAIVLFVVLSSVCYGSYKIILELDEERRTFLGYITMAMLSVVYFQYFGNYVMFLLIVEGGNFLIYTMASISLLVMAFLTFKLAFFVFMVRNIAHPDIRAQGFRSPRGKFVFYWLFFMLVNYVCSTILVRYVSYSYYLVAISSFPLINLVENILNGYRGHFNL